MKGEDLLRGLTELDEKWIEEASAPVERKKKPPVFYYRILAACAVYLIVGSAVFFAWQHDSGQNRLQLYQESEAPEAPEETEATDRTDEPADSSGGQSGIGTVAPFGTGNPPLVLGTAVPQPIQQPHSNTAVRPPAGQNGVGSVYEDSHINKSDIFHSIHDVQGAEGWGGAPNGANEGTTSRPGGENSGISRPSSLDPEWNTGYSTPKPPGPDAIRPQSPKPTQAPKPTSPPKTPPPHPTAPPQLGPTDPPESPQAPKPTPKPSWTEEPDPWDPIDSEMPTPTEFPPVTDEPAWELHTYGDLNGDGKISTEDAVLVLRHIQNTALLNQEQLKYADVDGDGEVTMDDYSLILQMASGIIDRFPVEEREDKIRNPVSGDAETGNKLYL